MPYKDNESRRHHFKKHTYRQTNYAEYNQSLRDRGRIDIWLSDDIIENWQTEQRSYDGTGSSPKYPDSTIMACHYLRLVFKQPLRQTQGFIDSLLQEMGYTNLSCPDFSCLSKRLSKLELKTPKFKKTDKPDEYLAAIAIDSTGLKEFGKGEWHQEKHKVNVKRSWKKAHFAVGDEHIIHGAILTKKDTMDFQVVEELSKQVDVEVDHVSADKMYDTDDVYDALTSKFPESDIAIPPKGNLYADDAHNPKRMSNLVAYSALGPIRWQKKKQYGKRNVSENAMHRYKTIIGPKLHSRDFNNQQQEMMLGASILNRFTQLGMPESYRVA
ncbi:IS5 family transposase [Vibrio minamisatsumaniensis]|uniref:IS5 family transposase n=1 Tax=Vibrio minamisatsumaniensis TaxID=2910243 RepID=UPI003D20FAA2